MRGESERLAVRTARGAASERMSVERHGVLTPDRAVVVVTAARRLHVGRHDDRPGRQHRARPVGLVNARNAVPPGRVRRQAIACMHTDTQDDWTSPHSRSHRPLCGCCYLFRVSNSCLLFPHVVGSTPCLKKRPTYGLL